MSEVSERYPLGVSVPVSHGFDEWPAVVVGYYGDGEIIVQSQGGAIPDEGIAHNQAWVMSPLYLTRDRFDDKD